MRSFVLVLGLVVMAGSLLGSETVVKKNDLYEDKGKSLKRVLSSEDRKNLLKDSGALSKKDVHKLKKNLKK